MSRHCSVFKRSKEPCSGKAFIHHHALKHLNLINNQHQFLWKGSLYFKYTLPQMIDFRNTFFCNLFWVMIKILVANQHERDVFWDVFEKSWIQGLLGCSLGEMENSADWCPNYAQMSSWNNLTWHTLSFIFHSCAVEYLALCMWVACSSFCLLIFLWINIRKKAHQWLHWSPHTVLLCVTAVFHGIITCQFSEHHRCWTKYFRCRSVKA